MRGEGAMRGGASEEGKQAGAHHRALPLSRILLLLAQRQRMRLSSSQPDPHP